MPTIRITDDQHDRIERLRAELLEPQAGPYASVTPGDVLAYLLDLADEVNDPGRQVDLGESEQGAADSEVTPSPFPRDRLERQLDARNRKHTTEEADEMDLYTIAAGYDIAGRSNMTKAELVDAILAEAKRLHADPFHWVDIDIQATDWDADSDADGNADGPDTGVEPDTPETESSQPAPASHEADTEGDSTGTPPDEAETKPDRGHSPDGPDGPDGIDGQDDAGGADQLTAALSLLETHDDKWWQADGDARYEVQLPDGRVETARTKDDVRAVLFKNY